MSIYDLLPSKLDAFYTYSGSLTTPPCYQVVNWIVMAQRLNMNAKQIELFRQLYAPAHGHQELAGEHGHLSAKLQDGGRRGEKQEQSDHEQGGHGEVGEQQQEQQQLIVPNVRLLQPLNNRTILASFNKYGSRIEGAELSAATRPRANLLLLVALGSLVASGSLAIGPRTPIRG